MDRCARRTSSSRAQHGWAPAFAAALACAAAGCGGHSLSAARTAGTESPFAVEAPRAVGGVRNEAAAVDAGGDFETVLLVSVDGLRSDALMALPAGSLPAFERLRHGAHTLNARTDPDRTVTLPNHTGMVTGRLVEGPGGHAWIRNDDVQDGENLHSRRGAYVCGVFDVAHDRGAWTGIWSGKPKFHLYDDSWNEATGAPDALPPDDGRDKVDVFRVELGTSKLVDAFLPALLERAGRKQLHFVHFAAPDLIAHARGWDLTPGSAYLKAIAEVDAGLGRILDAIEASDALRGRSAIVLTADHGGGAPFKSHDQPHMWVDYIIPFLVWTGGAEAADLYAINAEHRRDPGLARPRPGDGSLPPVRNADAANLVLDLLGFPPVPGSTVNAQQELRAAAPRANGAIAGSSR